MGLGSGAAAAAAARERCCAWCETPTWSRPPGMGSQRAAHWPANPLGRVFPAWRIRSPYPPHLLSRTPTSTSTAKSLDYGNPPGNSQLPPCVACSRVDARRLAYWMSRTDRRPDAVLVCGFGTRADAAGDTSGLLAHEETEALRAAMAVAAEGDVTCTVGQLESIACRVVYRPAATDPLALRRAHAGPEAARVTPNSANVLGQSLELLPGLFVVGVPHACHWAESEAVRCRAARMSRAGGGGLPPERAGCERGLRRCPPPPRYRAACFPDTDACRGAVPERGRPDERDEAFGREWRRPR